MQISDEGYWWAFLYKLKLFSRRYKFHRTRNTTRENPTVPLKNDGTGMFFRNCYIRIGVKRKCESNYGIDIDSFMWSKPYQNKTHIVDTKCNVGVQYFILYISKLLLWVLQNKRMRTTNRDLQMRITLHETKI